MYSRVRARNNGGFLRERDERERTFAISISPHLNFRKEEEKKNGILCLELGERFPGNFALNNVIFKRFFPVAPNYFAVSRNIQSVSYQLLVSDSTLVKIEPTFSPST